MKVFILGAGHVGTALSIIFKRVGLDVFIASRHLESVRKAAKVSYGKVCMPEEVVGADIVFLTVPDSEIVNAAERIKKFLSEKQIVVHTSGAFSSDIIGFLPSHVASLHPLKSFADPVSSANSIEGTLFTFEGDSRAKSVLEDLVKKIGGKFVEIDRENKILYHLAAVLTANYTVSLVNVSVNILRSIGFSEKNAEFALANLLNGVVRNIKNKGVVASLTGPIERGDAETIKEHLKAIKDPLVKNIYIFLAFATLNVAKQKGLSKKKFDDIRKVLNEQNNCS